MAGIKSVVVDVKGKTITVVYKLVDPPTISKSGKSYIHAGTGGAAETSTEINGMPVYVNTNITTYVEPKPSKG